MVMFLPVYLAALAAFVFYALLPVAGAFVVREQWRVFRKRVLESSTLPKINASLLGTTGPVPGKFLVQGEVDAIGGQNELWLSGNSVSCIVNLHDAWVYLLTDRTGEDRIERRRWRGMQSISPGTRVYASGSIVVTGGRIILGRIGKEMPLVILHDGNDMDAVRRSVWSGRHENEYWNPLTQVSLALGVAALSGTLSLSLPGNTPSLVRALMLCLAFSPILPLVPPGVIGFFAYRRFWKQARYFRAMRDVSALSEADGASSSVWKRRSQVMTAASVASFISSLALNAWIAFFLLRRFL